MDITVKFSLPDDEHSYRQFLDSEANSAALREFASWLRGEWKYKQFEPAEFELIDRIYTHLLSVCSDENIDPIGG